MYMHFSKIQGSIRTSDRPEGGLRGLAVFLLCMSLLAGVGKAQVGAASLSGVVQDSSGAIVPNATVTLQNIASGAQRVSSSNGSGSFTFSAVPSGDYKLTIQRTGFKQLVESPIHLNAGDSLTLPDLHISLGQVDQTVTVATEFAGLPLDSGQLSATITSGDLDRLSVVGRDATELQRILPGFAIRATSNGQNSAPDFSQVQIGQATPYASNGAPVAGITLKLDGANLTDAGNFGANLQNINDSWVSEVQVQTSNFGTDQSNGPVVITGVTKSGTSTYHGSLYTYARTYQLNSNDWLGNYNGIVRPNDTFVYPGGTIGGPVPHLKKLTFFAGAEYDAQRNVYAYGSAGSAILHALVPTAAMRKGDFSATSLMNYLGPNYTSGTYANISPTPTVGAYSPAGPNGPTGAPLVNGNIAAFLDPGAMALVNGTMPLPNEATGTDGFNYVTENLTDNNVGQVTGRVDYAISPKNLFFARYTWEKEKQGQPLIPYYSPGGSTVFGALNTPGGGVLDEFNVNSASANYVTVFTPTLTNELYATLMIFHQNFVAKNLGALQKSAINYPYNGIFDNGSTQYPQLGDYGTDGLPLGLWPDFSYGPLYLKKFQPSVGDNLTKVWGKHTVKLGIFAQRITNNQVITNGDSNGQIRDYYYGPAGTEGRGYFGKYADGTPAYGNTNVFASGNWLANFFEGQIQVFDQQNILPHTDVYYWNTDFYLQDNWRITPRLVLNYGLRMEHLGAWTDADGYGAAIFTPNTITTAPSLASNRLPGFQWHSQNPTVPNSGTGSKALFFEPRAGFAFDLLGTGKTMLRGGFGAYRFHDSEADVNAAFANSTGLRTADLQGFGANILAGIDTVRQDPYTYGFTGTQTSLPIAATFGLDPTDNTDPVTYNYSLSVAQQLPKNAIVQVSYVGNNSNSLMNNGTQNPVTLNNVNAIPVGTLFTPTAAAKINAYVGYNKCNPTGCTPQQAASLDTLNNYPGDPNIQVVRPYTQYGSITVPHHNTYANYNAIQALVQKQTGRLNYGLNYTFSKALGILGSAADFNYTAPIDPFNLYNNYGPMAFDHSQILNLSYSYQSGRIVQDRLLGGFVNNWLISGITNLQSGANLQTGVSGFPNYQLTGTIGNGANAYPVNNQSILGTPDVSLQPTLKCSPRANLTTNQYVNGACFGLPALGTNGQAIEPYAHGPGFFNSDLTVEKGFGLGGERRLRLRYAAFNFINHPLHSFGTGYASQINLNLTDTSTNATPATAVYSPSSGFGFAPLKLGRRLSEISLKYEF
jgi:hypothetical protein